MNHEFRLVDIGEGLTEAEIVSWLVAVGDHVVEDQPVVEIETDKAVVEMPAPVTGTVVELGGEVGSVVAVGDVLLVVDDGTVGASEERAIETAASAPTAERAPTAQRPLATPATRALARQLGVDLSTISGSGPGGRIVDADVTAAEPAAASPDAAPTVAATTQTEGDRDGGPRAGSRIALRGVRKRTAETMTAAWQAVPHVDSFHEIDVTELFALRDQFKPVAERRGVPLTLTAFFVKATALALVEHPLLNSSIDVAAGEIVLHPHPHLGVAVDTADGLVLPVLRHADERPLLDIAGDLARLGDAARQRRLSPAELAGSTFTISNHGVFGGWFGTSLVHGSEVGIAGFGPARRRPEFDAEDQVVARRILVMNLAADHRVVDGRDIINFGLAIRRRLEAPLPLLFDGD
jgi:pyruvate/2-oxoglutarate dehydrogenase complex dihydrolipoamide acyltransferase (E2) component